MALVDIDKYKKSIGNRQFDSYEDGGEGLPARKIIVVNDDLTKLIDYDGGNYPIYIGWAKPGTATSATTGWKIQKLTWSGSQATATEWADGSAAFDKEWDERASYSYS